VLARILDGYDYIVNFSVNGIELKVLGRSGLIARPSDVPPPPGPATAASQAPPVPPVFIPEPQQIRPEIGATHFAPKPTGGFHRTRCKRD
jgi:hypothetical protein